MDGIFQDVRYAWRSLRKQAAFAVLTVLTLALGIGANAAIFSVVDAVLLRPLDFDHPERIVAVKTWWRQTGLGGQASAPDFHDWHDQASSFDAMAYYIGGETSVSVAGAADYATVMRVSPGFFQIFGLSAQTGRLLAPGEEKAGGPLAVVIGHDLWVRRFGARPAVIGRTIGFDDRLFTIVGVLPSGFRFPGKTDVWYASWVRPETISRSAHNYSVVARLKSDRTFSQAQSEMRTIAARLEQAYPLSNQNKSAAVVPLQESLVGDTRPTLYLLVGVVALVLLIACANVANLLLARGTARTGEIGVRAALGASRTRLVRQLVTESALLAFAGGVLGLLLARLGVRTLVLLAPAHLPRLTEIAIDARVILFALLASLMASLVFGVVPALEASRIDLNTSLRHGGRGSAADGSGARLRSALVVVEVALAVALVIGASLLVRSFLALGRVELGFNAEHVLVVETSVPSKDLDGARRATRFYAELLPRLAAAPLVASVAGIRGLPASTIHSNGGYWLEGGPGPDQVGVRSPQAIFTVVTPDYFRTMKIPLREGRDFSDRDRLDAPMTAIVNDALVRQAFAGRDAIGHRIMCGLDTLQFMTIVGVAGDVREYDPSLPPAPEIYMPFQQHPAYGSTLTLVARTSSDPMRLATMFQEIIRGANPDVPVRAGTMDDTLAVAVAAPRFRTLLLGSFAALALCLAIAGVYGVMAYNVGRRTAEIGVRMALGAAPSDVVRLVMRQGLALAGAGILVGWGLAVVVAKLISSMLFAVGAGDPIAFGIVPMVLLATAAASCAGPAARAARVDPLHALRSE